MKDLIARLEAATGPDRALDWAIRSHVTPHLSPVSPERAAEFAKEHGYPEALPAYTASLDCALSLVPEGDAWALQWTASQTFAWATVGEADHTREPFGSRMAKAPTPALALCIAALRAREAGDA